MAWIVNAQSCQSSPAQVSLVDQGTQEYETYVYIPQHSLQPELSVKPPFLGVLIVEPHDLCHIHHKHRSKETILNGVTHLQPRCLSLVLIDLNIIAYIP